MSKFFELIDAAGNKPAVTGIALVIWSIILGIIIALCLSFYNRRVIGSFFRALIKSGALDTDSAKTIAEISQNENDAAISRLKHSESFRRMVTIVNENGTQTIDENTKFYLTESQLIRVRGQWGEKNESIGALIGGVLGMLILGALITIVVILNTL